MRRDRDLHGDRLALGAAAVFTVSEAANLLHGNDAVNRSWLRDHGLVATGPNGGELVVWGDVLEALRLAAGKRRPPRSAPDSSGPVFPEGRVDLRGPRRG